MRVLGLTDHHIDSGIGYYGISLFKELQNKGTAQLYKPYRSNHRDSEMHSKFSWLQGVNYKSLRNLRPYILPFFLRAGIQTDQVDVVHAHWFLSGLAATYFQSRPTIITIHDVSLLHVSDSNDRYLPYYKWAINRFRKLRIPLIVVSRQAKQDTIEFAKYPEHLVHVVYNGIDQNRFYPMYRQRSNDKFVIAYSGGLGRRKNLHLLLEAVSRLQPKYDNIEVKIAGAHPGVTEYPAMAKELNLEGVEFTGFIPDQSMNQFYNSADLMVYTSEYEGFGMAPLEAMSAGVPVITTTGGALAEVSGPGAITTSYSAEEIAFEIEKMMLDKAHRDRTAARGFEWVKCYSWELAAESTLKLYENIV